MNQWVALGRCLVVDASTFRLQVGIWEDNRWLAYACDTEGPLESLFGKIYRVLQESSLALHDFQGMLFCQGPGSLLGIRMTALAMQAWQLIGKGRNCIVASYSSLDLACHIVGKTVEYPLRVWTETTQGECLWVAPLRKGEYPAPERCSLKDFKDKTSSWHLVQRTTPDKLQESYVVDYNLDRYPEFISNVPLIHLSKGDDCIGLGANRVL